MINIFTKSSYFIMRAIIRAVTGRAVARKDVFRVTFTRGNAASVRRGADNFTVGRKINLRVGRAHKNFSRAANVRVRDGPSPVP